MSIKTIYWLTTTGIISFLFLSSYSYIFSKSTIDEIRNMGLPDYLRIELVVLKIVAALVLILPNSPLFMKEWAYAGIALFFITAIVAHMANKDAIVISLINVLLIGVLFMSRFYLYKLNIIN